MRARGSTPTGEKGKDTTKRRSCEPKTAQDDPASRLSKSRELSKRLVCEIPEKQQTCIKTPKSSNISMIPIADSLEDDPDSDAIFIF